MFYVIRPTLSTTPVGMDKLNTQTLGRNAWTKITGWTPRAGYGSTVIISDNLAVLQSGTYNVSIGATMSASSFQIRLMANGSVLSTSSSATTTFLEYTNQHFLAAGDSIWMEIYTTQIGSTSRVVQAGAGTYLKFDAA